MDEIRRCDFDKGVDVDSAETMQRYHFTKNWFAPKIPLWEYFIGDFKDCPDIHYLEIGVHEGSSFFWMMDNILTHPDSRAVVIDPFLSNYVDQFNYNLNASGASDRVTIIQGRGEVETKKLPEESFDIIYIDGGHTAQIVFAQAAFTWQLLKTGGILIFDDYLWRKDKWPIDLRPEMVIDTFLTAYSQELELLNRKRNIFVRKVNGSGKLTRSKFFDQYVYDWSKQKLFAIADDRKIELAANEREFIERYLLSLKHSQVKPELTPDMIQESTFVQLKERLNLNLA